MSGALRRRYGAGPLHLLSVLAMLGVAGYAFTQIVQQPSPASFAIYFAAAIVAHDLIAFPLYSLLDRLAGAGRAAAHLPPASINYLRVPALLSGFALVVWFPLVLGLDRANYEAAAGIEAPDFLGRWLLLTAALFAASGLTLALRQRRARRAGRATDPPGPRTPR